jgi:hypothetical protein
MSTSDPQPPRVDPADPSSEEARDAGAPGGTPREAVNDDLPLPNDPVDGGLAGDDLVGEAPD